MKHLFIFLFVFCGAVLVGGQDRQQLKEEIDKIIYFDTEISQDAIPGYVIGIIVGDSVFVYSYGQISKTNPLPPDENTLFEIGSVTKVFTATLVGLLIDEGLLHRDSSLNIYMPHPDRNPDLEQVTITKLLTHTSGLPKMPIDFGLYEKDFNNPYANYPKEALLEFFKNYKPRKTKKQLKKKKGNYLYSHLNYALLEIAIENVTGEDYATLLRQYIFAKANMQKSFVQFHNQEQIDQMASGYARSGKQVDPWEFASFSASEGMKSSARDLIRFVQIHLDDLSNPIATSYYSNTLPAIETGLTENASMGYGWHILHQKKYHDIVLHAGSTSGHRAFISFIRETKTGVVLLSNSENGTGGLGYLLLRLINFNWKKK